MAALAARSHWLIVEWPPKYAPELNDIEVVWRDLKAHHLAHQTFADIDALDQAIHHAVKELNVERTVLPLVEPRISAMKIAWRIAKVMRTAHMPRPAPPPFSSIMARRMRWLAAMKIAWRIAKVMRTAHMPRPAPPPFSSIMARRMRWLAA